MHICHGGLDVSWTWPDLGDVAVGCCYGSAERGPQGCTCWEPVYDLEQQPILHSDLFDLSSHAGVDRLWSLVADACTGTPCGDCAYRPDSPEKAGADHVTGDQAQLDHLVATGTPFWCHQGIRRPVSYVHPTGATFTPPGDVLDAAYAPPQHNGVPYKADGTHADLCRGWAIRRAIHVRDTAAR